MRAEVDRPEVTRLDAPSAFRAVLPHAYSFSLSRPERTQRMFDSYVRLSQTVPVYRVRFRPDLARADELMEVLERSMLTVG
jgi:hypothetical protein